MKRILLAIAAVALLGAACSSDSDGGIEIGSGDEANESADTGAATGDDSGDDDSGDDGGLDIGSGGSSDWCGQALSFNEDLEGFDPFSDTEALAGLVDAMEGLGATAPNDEVADAIETSAEGFRLLIDAVDEAGGNFLDVAESDLLELDDPKYDEASATIDAYLEEECGFDPDSFGTEGEDTAPEGDDDGDLDLGDVEVPEGGTIEDAIVQSLVQSGFTEAEASCLAAEMGGDLSGLANAEDPTAILDIFESCGLDLSRLAEIGG